LWIRIAELEATIAIVDNKPTMAMTTRSSTSVKASRFMLVLYIKRQIFGIGTVFAAPALALRVKKCYTD
jgi:hypothetical protein